jgi:hypothetical protein
MLQLSYLDIYDRWVYSIKEDSLIDVGKVINGPLNVSVLQHGNYLYIYGTYLGFKIQLLCLDIYCWLDSSFKEDLLVNPGKVMNYPLHI